jgi:hypothetical protein
MTPTAAAADDEEKSAAATPMRTIVGRQHVGVQSEESSRTVSVAATVSAAAAVMTTVRTPVHSRTSDRSVRGSNC